MPPRFLQQVYLALLILTNIVQSIPEVAFPVNSQLPPVAYASQPFEFTFSPNTFVSAGSVISYSLQDQPAWLSLDSSSRRLSGTPASLDVGTPTFGLVASDESGQRLLNVTIVILQEKLLYPSAGQILLQLASAGSVSSPTTLLLYPQHAFGFSLLPNLFNGVSASTIFYSVSVDNSPLPSWLQFDSQSLQFSGTTPPLLQPVPAQHASQFSLIASNIVGFSEAIVQFEILVSDRILAFQNSTLAFTVLRGSSFRIASLLGQITVDGSVAEENQIVSAVANNPSWLKFNSRNLSFEGIAPGDFQNLAFWLAVSSSGTNTANVSIAIQAGETQNLQQSSLGNVSAVSGSYFVYRITPPSTIGANILVTVNSSDLPSWLLFTAANLTLHGLVPSDAVSEALLIPFTFGNGLQAVVSNLNLTITGHSSTPTIIGSSTSSSTETTSPATSLGVTNDTSTSDTRLVTILLATILPVLAVILCSVIVCVWLRKRKQGQKDATKTFSPEELHHPEIQEVAAEVHPVETLPNSLQPVGETEEAGSKVPRIELSWTPSFSKHRRKQISKKPRSSQSSALDSSWDDLIEMPHQPEVHAASTPVKATSVRRDSVRPASAMPPPLRMAPKRPARPDSQPGSAEQQSSVGARQNLSMQQQVFGLPRRLSAAGHGAGGSQSHGIVNPRLSWQTTMSSLHNNDRRPSEIIISSFPEPPSQGDMTSAYENSTRKDGATQHTLRLVESNSNSSGSFDDTKQTFHTRRARERLEGKPRFSTRGSKYGSRHVLSDAIIESPSEHLADDTSRLGYGNTGGSGPPPLPRKSRARRSISHDINSRQANQYMANQFPSGRELSVASSHQFDSAVSSDSQWEDDDRVDSQVTEGSHPERSIHHDIVQPVSSQTSQAKGKGRDMLRPQRSDGSFRFI